MRMRTIVLSGVLLSIAGCKRPEAHSRTGDADTAISFDHVRGAILPAESAASVLAQCTRMVPLSGSGYWRPSEKDVRQLERYLPTLLDSALARVSPVTRTVAQEEYIRQYVGIVRGDRRTIYVNGFHSSFEREFDGPWFVVKIWGSRWEHQPVVVCDGGAAFFGIEYDIQSRSFGDIQFNHSIQ